MRNATTRLVGTFTDGADVVHNFDILFDKGDDTAINTEIYWLEEIDRIIYECGYEKRDNGYWYFSVEYFNTKLTLAEIILKQDEIALKSDITSLLDDLYWRIFYSGFHKSYYEDIPELCWYSYDTSSKKYIVFVEYNSLYMEMLFIFYDSRNIMLELIIVNDLQY